MHHWQSDFVKFQRIAGLAPFFLSLSLVPVNWTRPEDARHDAFLSLSPQL